MWRQRWSTQRDGRARRPCRFQPSSLPGRGRLCLTVELPSKPSLPGDSWSAISVLYSQVIVLFTAGLAAQTGGLGPKLLAAIRKGDVSAVDELLRDNADPNSRDETGASALMYATAFSSPECMRLLITKGADVDGVNQVHATALMWAGVEPEKVKLLLSKNAGVNMRTDDGQSALLLAARRPGNIETVRLLLSHGADPKAVDKEGVGFLRIAYGQEDAALQQAARSAGLECTRLEQLGDEPLLTALGSGDKDLIATVFRLGVNPNELIKIESAHVPSIGLLAFEGATPPIRILLDHGANPNVKSDRGFTPLMMAAAADMPDLELVRLLVQKGADVNARDLKGRTVLDWALTQGETEVSKFLRSAGAKSTPLQPPPAPRWKRCFRGFSPSARRSSAASAASPATPSRCPPWLWPTPGHRASTSMPISPLTPTRPPWRCGRLSAKA